MRPCIRCGSEFAPRTPKVRRCDACATSQANNDWNRFGLTGPESVALRSSGTCHLCGTTEPKGNGWQIDHDHDTGRVRGLLCHHCNVGLGHFCDDPARLRAAITYLRKARVK